MERQSVLTAGLPFAVGLAMVFGHQGVPFPFANGDGVDHEGNIAGGKDWGDAGDEAEECATLQSWAAYRSMAFGARGGVFSPEASGAHEEKEYVNSEQHDSEDGPEASEDEEQEARDIEQNEDSDEEQEFEEQRDADEAEQREENEQDDKPEDEHLEADAA